MRFQLTERPLDVSKRLRCGGKRGGLLIDSGDQLCSTLVGVTARGEKSVPELGRYPLVLDDRRSEIGTELRVQIRGQRLVILVVVMRDDHHCLPVAGADLLTRGIACRRLRPGPEEGSNCRRCCETAIRLCLIWVDSRLLIVELGESLLFSGCSTPFFVECVVRNLYIGKLDLIHSHSYGDPFV